MRIELCGRAALVGPGGRRVDIGRPQVQLCLAALALERHRPITRDELAHVLWGDDLSAHWQGAVRGVLAKLRGACVEAGFGDDVVEASAGTVTLALPDDVEVDVETARHAAQLAETALRCDDPAGGVEHARRAMAILSRRFLVSVDAAWADERRFELAELSRRSGRLLGRAHLAAGEAIEAVAVLRRLVRDDPYDEDQQLLLLHALGASGDLHEVRRAHAAYVEVLDAELGVPPSARVGLAVDGLLGRSPGGEAPDVAPDAATRVRGDGARTSSAEHATASGDAAPFVGRERELATLVASSDAARAVPGPRLVVVKGPSGIGKTRLAAEAAHAAAADGARILWGSCDAETKLPYQPLAEAIAGALADDPAARSAIEDLLPDLAPLGIGAARSRAAGAGHAAGLTNAVTEALRRLAGRGALWIVDDFQWIDPDAAALLRRVLRSLGAMAVTVVAACRDLDPGAAAALADLGRVVPTDTLRLGGLDRDAVTAWLEASAVPDAGDAAETLRRRTGGNPLFLREIIDAAAHDAPIQPSAVPEALRDLLARRLDALGRDANLVLVVAAVSGAPVDLPFVATVAALDDASLLAATDRLVAEGLLVERDTSLVMGHAVVRDVVLDRLGPARRSWFHLRTADALLAAPPEPGVAARLARHFATAGPGHGDAARHWALVAAEDALDRVAWDRAGALARSVLAASAAAPDHRAGALVVLGRSHRGLGDHEAAEAALEEAMELARLHALHRRFAEAVLALAGGGGRGVPDEARFRWVALLEEALAALDDDDDDLRVPLLGSLAVALLLTDRDDDRRRAADRALDLARRRDEPALMARALLDHRFALGAEHAPGRLREVDEALALAGRAHLPEVRTAALVYRHEDLLLLGDRDGARTALAEVARHLERHPDPYWEWAAATWAVPGHLLDGDLAVAEEAASSAWALQPEGAWAQACFGVNLVAIRILQGRAHEVVGLLERAARDQPHIPCYRAVLAYAALDVGDRGRARRELDAFAADGFRSVPDDTNRVLTLAMLAEVAVGLGSTRHAEPLAALLDPYSDLHVVLNCFGGGGAVWGPVAAQRAALADLGGDAEAAASWHRRAAERCERVGDRIFTARLAERLATAG